MLLTTRLDDLGTDQDPFDSAHFANMNLVFDTTFCGDWAGQASVWSSSGCSALASTCTDYVSNSPGAFAPAYWLLNTVKVYQLA